MSEDNECGFYCEHPDGHYYTIGITNRNVVKTIAVLTFFFYHVPFFNILKSIDSGKRLCKYSLFCVCKTQKS